MFARRSPPLPAAVVLMLTILATAAGSACDRSAPDATTVTPQQPEYAEPGQVPAGSRIVVVILGDSLTAGLGLVTAQAFPARLQAKFEAEGYSEVEILDAGVSGDTTAGGLRRVESLLAPGNVRILVVALGGNDALRGLSVTQTRQNLKAIVDTALESGVDVMLTGMEGPTNLGEDYRARFRATFSDLAAEYGSRVTFVPFLLEGVAGNPALNQADGIHPNAEGAALIADHLYQPLQNMVDQLSVTQ